MSSDLLEHRSDLPTMMNSVLLIGIGNPLRGDDGAGALLAERMAQLFAARGLHVHLRIVQQLTPELALDIAAAEIDAVIFNDVAATQLPNDAIHVSWLDAGAASASFSHHVAPATLLAYASALYGRCPTAWLVTVPGEVFAIGAPISPLTMRCLQQAEYAVETIASQTLNPSPPHP
jgi:hydrogenase maturation protease